MYDIARGTLNRVTFSPGLDVSPIWNPDNRRLTYNSVSVRSGSMEILQAPFDGSGSEERLIDAGAANAQHDRGTRAVSGWRTIWLEISTCCH